MGKGLGDSKPPSHWPQRRLPPAEDSHAAVNCWQAPQTVIMLLVSLSLEAARLLRCMLLILKILSPAPDRLGACGVKLATDS